MQVQVAEVQVAALSLPGPGRRCVEAAWHQREERRTALKAAYTCQRAHRQPQDGKGVARGLGMRLEQSAMHPFCLGEPLDAVIGQVIIAPEAFNSINRDV